MIQRVSLREMTETILADPCLASDKNQVARDPLVVITRFIRLDICTIYFDAHSLSNIRAHAHTRTHVGARKET